MSSEKKSSCGKCQFWKKMIIFSDVLVYLLSIMLSIEIYFSIRAVGSWMSSWMTNMNVDISHTVSWLDGLFQFILFIYPIIASLFITSHIKFKRWRTKCSYYDCSYDYEQDIEADIDELAILVFSLLSILYTIFIITNLKSLLTPYDTLHTAVVSSWICTIFTLIFTVLFVD